MSHLEHPLFNPHAGSKAQTEDAVAKGLMDADRAEPLLLAAAWVEANMDALVEEFETDVVVVVADDTAEDGFAKYPASTVFEGWMRALQFSPGLPWVAFDPTGESVTRVLLDVPEGGLGPMTSVFVNFGGVGPFFRQAKGGTKDDEDLAKKLREILEKLDAARLKAIEDGLKTGKLDDLDSTYYLGREIRVGGQLTDGKKSVPKDWVVDTGATGSMLSKSNFDALVKKGAKPKKEGEIKAATASGIVTVPMYSGLKMRFARKDAKGKRELVDCTTPLAVGAFDLLGVDQLKNTKTRLNFDPANGKAELHASPR